jgi:hypothetical protein
VPIKGAAFLFSCGPFPHEDEAAKSPQRLRRRTREGRAGLLPVNEKCMNVSKQAIEAETSGNTTLRANGTGSRAVPSKVLTSFEGAHLFRKVSILENLDDSFEDAHPFPRCSPEHAKIRNGG